MRPDVVEERYMAGLRLLNHYFDKPDLLQLFDNSETMAKKPELVKGKVIFTVASNALPTWITNHLPNVLGINAPAETKERGLNSIEEVRSRYNETRAQAEQKKDTQPDQESNDPGRIRRPRR